MRRNLRTPAVLSLALVLCAACAGGIPRHLGQQQTRDRYAAYAGPPIPSFTWLGRYDGWEALGKDELVIFTTPNDAYLLKIWPPCDMRFVFNGIGLSSTGRTVTAHLDSVITNSPSTGRWRCPIDEIRKIDYQRMRADLRAQTAAPVPTQAPPAVPAPPLPQAH
jgi:nucleoid-associated protein YgaU